MQSETFVIEPDSLPLDDVTVSAALSLNKSKRVWNVTVILARAPGQEFINGEDVEAQLLDDQGNALKVLERPSGPLVEAGGAMSVSANAIFRFQGSEAAPANLLISYHGETAQFWVRHAGGSEGITADS